MPADKIKAAEIKAIRLSAAHKEWSDAVRTRDHFTCQRCGKQPKRRKSIHAHHIEPFAKHAGLRFELTNGITLCRICHRYVHSHHIDFRKPTI